MSSPKRHYRKIITALATLSFSSTVTAQIWTKAIDLGTTATTEIGTSVCSDQLGNFYLSGRFANTIDFDPNSGTAVNNLTASGAANNANSFLTKYGPTGDYRWALALGVSTSTTTIVNQGLTYSKGYVYALGTFSGTATFGATSLTSAGVADVYVLKADTATGAIIWAQKYGAATAEQGHSICVDTAGNPYILGLFTTNITLGTTTLTSGGSNDIFVAKLSPADGAVIWAMGGGSSAGGDGGASNGAIAYDIAHNKIVVGTIYNTSSGIYGGFTLSNVGGNDVAIVELNPATGAVTNAVSFGSVANEFLAGGCYDPATGDVFFAGSYENAVTLPGAIVLPTSTSSTSSLFLGRYSTASHTFVAGLGNVVSSGAGTGLNNSIRALSPNGHGSIFAAATFQTGITLGGSAYTGVSGTELIVSRYNANTLVFEGATVVTGSGGSDVPFGIAANGIGNLMIAGQSNSSLTFPGLAAITNVSGADIFFAHENVPTISTTIPASVTATGATFAGNAISDGGNAITERGIVYSTTANPTTASTKVIIGTGTGTFSQNISSLASNTTYYTRSYIINSSGTYYGAERNFTTGTALPIRLISFAGTLKNTIASLKWQTGEEENADHFEIERSTDGIVYSTVAKVTAKGRSNIYTSDVTQYDATALYRLKLVAKDGGNDLSKVISLSQTNSKIAAVHPNPVSDRLYIDGNINAFGQIRLTTITGQDITDKVSISGRNTQQVTIDMHNLANGLYFVKTATNTFRITKQ